MYIEKEVIGPGTTWYRDETTGLPRKLVVTPELTKYWCDQGNAMLGAGLTVPVPCEHDLKSHPMTPAEQLINNAGWVKEYRLKGNTLFSVLDITNDDIRKKLPHTIRWTSPYINSFTDGKGKEWRNVISHLALTTRPRVMDQQPFGNVAAALSMAIAVEYNLDKDTWKSFSGDKGLSLSKAGLLFEDPTTKHLLPKYPVAFSLWGGGIKLSDGDAPPKKKKDTKKEHPKKKEGGETPPKEGEGGKPPFEGGGDEGAEGSGLEDGEDSMDPLADAQGDVSMEEILCDLLQALGVPMPDDSNEHEFKRHLYEAAMCKIKDLASKGDPNSPQNTAKQKIPSPGQPNPLIGQVQQEQQPMYMSLDDINKLPDPMKGVALAMYAENQKLRVELDSNKKVTDSLRDAKLKEAASARDSRVSLLSRLSPKVKADLDSMLTLPSMALSMGDGGAVLDPMAQTLAILEKGLADLPRLLTADMASLSMQPQPQDSDAMTDEKADKIAEEMERQMGCQPRKKAS
jgi:hypothetical protein